MPKIKKNVEIIGMVFKSPEYLRFMINGMMNVEKFNPKLDWKVGKRIIVNDAYPAVLEEIEKIKTERNDIEFFYYNHPNPYDFYLHRVYSAWVAGGCSSDYDNFVFINSDMYPSQDWLKNLLFYHDGINIPTSRLVEAGKFISGTYGVTRNFGRNPKEVLENEEKWLHFAESIKEDVVKDSGLFQPAVFVTDRYREFPSPLGNIGPSNEREDVVFGNATVKSGDAWHMDKLKELYGMQHKTVFNSVVYHVAEGEKDF
jgi:hypothetical protein